MVITKPALPSNHIDIVRVGKISGNFVAKNYATRRFAPYGSTTPAPCNQRRYSANVDGVRRTYWRTEPDNRHAHPVFARVAATAFSCLAKTTIMSAFPISVNTSFLRQIISAVGECYVPNVKSQWLSVMRQFLLHALK